MVELEGERGERSSTRQTSASRATPAPALNNAHGCDGLSTPVFPGRGGRERGSGVKLKLEIMSILSPREQLRRFHTLRVLAVQHAAQLLVFRL